MMIFAWPCWQLARQLREGSSWDKKKLGVLLLWGSGTDSVW
jgi:hypothetical protein